MWFLRKMWRKLFCDKFFYLKNILSSVKQEVDMQPLWNCVTSYSFPYWYPVPNIRKLACVVPEKNVTEIILWQIFYFKNTTCILSSLKQEVDMQQIWNCVWALLFLSSIKQVMDMRQIGNCLIRYSSPYWCCVPNIRKLTCVVPEKIVTEIILWQIFLLQNYSKFRQTGSENAADLKLCYTIQFSILMPCAKYQKGGMCGSWEKCEEIILWQIFYFKNILSFIKHEVNMKQIRNCVTIYSFPYWCSVPNIRKLACVVPEKSVTIYFVTTTPTQDGS